MDMLEFEIDDDSGLLGIVVASAYESFVSPDWTFEQLLVHFSAQTAAQNILVWDCGDNGDLYRLRVVDGFSDRKGFRDAIGVLNPVDGVMHIASYTALTMAAQFDDEPLPAKDEVAVSFQVPAGPVRIRVIQCYDPATVDYDSFTGPHFQIEYEPGTEGDWTGVAWNRFPAPDRKTSAGGLIGLISRVLLRRR